MKLKTVQEMFKIVSKKCNLLRKEGKKLKQTKIV